MSILSGIRRVFKKRYYYVGVRIIYDKDDHWRACAMAAYNWYSCTKNPKRQGWTGIITSCTYNRIVVEYDCGTIQSYSLDCILDKDLFYIKREDGEKW